MPRKPNQAAELIDPTTDAHDAHISQSATNLAVWQAQATENARAVAQQLHYNGLLDPNVLQQGIVESKARIGTELFAIGARLLLLREQCAHGEFVLRLESLNIDPRAARKYMQVALKFSKTATVAALDGLSLSKLLELAMLDDETLEVLESDGTVLGFKLDELDQMSVREMRVALREAKADYVAIDKLHTEKVARIKTLELAASKKVSAKIDWPEAFKGYVSQVQGAANTIKIQIGALDIVRETAMKIEAETPEEEASLQKAREVLATELLQIHRQCTEYLEAMGHMFNQTLGNFADEGR
jgi:phosphotransferase system HPr-like phosphotransfer protein